MGVGGGGIGYNMWVLLALTMNGKSFIVVKSSFKVLNLILNKE